MNRKHGSNVPLVLMNSFNTHSDTERIRFKYEKRVDLHMFQQSYYPRVLKETLRPYPEKVDLQDGRYIWRGEHLLAVLYISCTIYYPTFTMLCMPWPK